MRLQRLQWKSHFTQHGLVMKKGILTLLLVCVACAPQETNIEVVAWEAQAQNVTIIRDDWGVPHI